jgi:hypothetical protein
MKRKLMLNMRFTAGIALLNLASAGYILAAAHGWRMIIALGPAVIVAATVRRALEIRAILRNPLFYLVAISHDLGDQS